MTLTFDPSQIDNQVQVSQAIKDAIRLSDKEANEYILKMMERHNVDEHRAKIYLDGWKNNVIYASQLLYFDDLDTPIPAYSVFRNAGSLDGKTLSDPIEPEYGGGTAKAKFYANKSTNHPVIHSFAHGGIIYEFRFDAHSLIEYITGEANRWSDKGQQESFISSIPRLISDAYLNQIDEARVIHHVFTELGIPKNRLVQDVRNAKRESRLSGDRDTLREIMSHYNQNFAVVNLEGDIKVAHFRDEATHGVTFMSPANFFALQAGDRVTYKGKEEEESAKIWFNNKSRRTFVGLCFEPGRERFIDGKINLFNGWGCEAIEGDCSKIKQHILDVLADGQQGLYEYIMAWFADLFQNPMNRQVTMLGFTGDPGAGKSFLFDHLFNPLLEGYTLTAENFELITGNFNDSIECKLLIQLEEAVWGGSKANANALKLLITSTNITVNKKYMPPYNIRNCARFVALSNDRWMLPVEAKDRRYFVNKVSNKYVKNFDYFKALKSEIENGGMEAFLHEMLNYKSDINIAEPPFTLAKMEQMLSGLSITQEFMLEMLERGCLLYNGVEHKCFCHPISSTFMCDIFIDHYTTKRKSYIPGRVKAKQVIKEYVPEMLEFRDRDSKVSTMLPPLRVCRAHFEKLLGMEGYVWEFEPPGNQITVYEKFKAVYGERVNDTYQKPKISFETMEKILAG
jgi:hypothetical protein